MAQVHFAVGAQPPDGLSTWERKLLVGEIFEIRKGAEPLETAIQESKEEVKGLRGIEIEVEQMTLSIDFVKVAVS